MRHVQPSGQVGRLPLSALTARRWIVVAGGPAANAMRLADALPGEADVVSGSTVRRSPLALRRIAAEHHADAVVVQSLDWDRQRNPQLYELALALTPVPHRFLGEADPEALRPVGTGLLARRLAVLPFGLFRAGLTVAAETARYARRGRDRTQRPTGSPTAVLAIWIGAPGVEVGGSVTHISGILGGLRSEGLRTGLVTVGRVPDQLARVVDDVEIAHPLPAYARITNDVECLAVNAHVRRAAQTLAQRLQPSFVYQRHQPLLRAGLEAAHALAVPFVLEWNGSEVWTRSNWSSARGVDRLFNPLIASMERDVLERADAVIAVSQRAADVALELAAGSNVVVVPNGVDLNEVHPHSRAGTVRDTQPRLGWVGSFGPWHGAEILIRALALLPGVEAVMIGDGAERPRCHELAESLGVLPRIEFTGALPHDVVLRRLGECDLLVSPHTPLPGQPFFGSPTKLFEYMALGRPIVASALEQIGEVLEDGRTAKLVPPGDVAALAAAITDVLESPDGESLGRNARAEAESRHGWERRAADVLRVLEPADGR